MRTFLNTTKALVEYDAGSDGRDREWAEAETTVDIACAEQNDRDALRKVREAFYQDTQDINSLDNCLRVDIEFMRRMARGDFI